MLRRLAVVLPVLALGATTAVLVPATAGADTPVGTTGKTYVALGDSYAAGFGLPADEGTPTGEPAPSCDQTTGDYPHLLAAQLGLTLTDVTCSGARTNDFATSQAAGVPPQLDVFKTVQPDLVTVTIGGNDLGFSSISANCLAASGNGPVFLHPTFASCSAYFTSNAGAASNPTTRIQPTLDKVDAAIKAVKAAAPNAKIAVIAYPAIAPDTANTPAGGCYAANATPAPIPLPGLPVSVNSTFPFADADVPFLQQLQQTLNTGIGAVATANGAAYADVYPASLSHSACQPPSTRWVEPIIPAKALQGATNTLHPNLAGTTAMAATLAPVVQAFFPDPAPSTTAPGTTAPTGGSTGTTGPTSAGGGAPLAATGVDVPVSWLLGLATALFVAGGVALRAARPRSARH